MRSAGVAVFASLVLVAVTGCEAVVGIETLQIVREGDGGEDASDANEGARDADRDDAGGADAAGDGGADARRD